MGDSSTGAATPERRRHERLQPNQRVTIRCTEGVMSVFGWGRTVEVPALLDLSSGGARLAMPRAPEVGSVLRLDLKVDEGRSFEALGEIRWSCSGTSGSGGFQCGVEFIKSTSRLRQEITDLCRRVQGAPEEIRSSSRRTIPA